MKLSTFASALTTLAAAAVPLQAATPAAEKISPENLQFFEKKIRPVLAEHCYSCHSTKAEKLRAALLLDSKQGLLTGGTSGPAIVPGKPEKSLLIHSLKTTDKEDMMPPKGDRLSAAVIAGFELWIKIGAPDPRTDNGGAVAALKVDWEKAKTHWAYQPVQAPPIPQVKDKTKWARTTLDKHVLAKLESKGLEPTPIADKRTLIRRAAYDLTGLPPTPQEVSEFLADNSPNAFAKVVDRYLASPAYGERWGRHWLDVARYADTTGDRNVNAKRPANYAFAWTYRDYVIKAFNDDLPYDKFIIEQIAADRVAAEDRTKLAAMGFLTVGKRFMGNANEVIDDRIDVITQGLMGVTAACARCHDHKFDPVSQKDYYALHGIFTSSEEPEEEPIISKRGTEKDFAEYQEKIQAIEERMAGITDVEHGKVLAGFRQQVDKYLAVLHQVAGSPSAKKSAIVREKGLDPDIFDHWQDYLKSAAKGHDPVFAPWFALAELKGAEFAAKAPALAKQFAANADKDKPVNPLVAKALAEAKLGSITEVAELYGKLFKDAAKAKEKPEGAAGALYAVLHGKDSPINLNKAGFNRVIGVRIRNAEAAEKTKLDELRRPHPGSPVRAMALSDRNNPKDSFVMIRGEPNNRGPVVKRRFLEILGGSDDKAFKSGSGRLDLAKEVVSQDNPLTARVFVNRVWNWHFGDAIVRSLGDFGLRSEPPSNQALLDYLASQFMADGWSIKQLHRTIMLSATWQQAVRDNDRNYRIDPGNAYFWRQNLQRLDFESLRDTLLMLGGKAEFEQRGGPSVDLSTESARRTIYGTVDRAKIPDAYRIFDFANPDMTAPGRVLTTVPLQALYLMNNPFVVMQSRNISSRPELLSGAKDEEKISFLYQLFFQREPKATELQLALNYLHDQQAKPATGGSDIALWRYGYGDYDEAAKKLVDFHPFPGFVKDSWVIADKQDMKRAALPDKKGKSGEAMRAGFFAVSLNAVGGTPGDEKHSVVRRWTAPRDGVLSIEGKLEHDAKTGDGVEAFLYAANSGGQLASWKAAGTDVVTNVKAVKVKKGDTLDFVVTSRGTSEDDSFRWVPILHMAGSRPGEEYVWNSQREFSGPVKQKLETQPFTHWERLTQALLLSNELIYVN